MKKIFVLFALLCAFFSSCSDENDTDVATSNVKLPQVVTINSCDKVTRSADAYSKLKALSFANEEDFERFVGILRAKTSVQRIQLIKSLGFECLAMINDEADKELDAIGATATSEADFRAKYEIYKKKYLGILVANPMDKTDLSLYLPAAKDTVVSPYLVGMCNKVLVAGSLREIPFSDEMNEDDKIVFATNYSEVQSKTTRSCEKDYTDENSWPVNSFKERIGNHKIIFDSSVSDDYKLNFHFGAQYKMWYGWKRNNRQFFFRLENMDGCDKINPDANQSYLTPNTYFFGTGVDFYSYTKMDIHVADVKRLTPPAVDRYAVSGKMFLWTDLQEEKDANGNVIYQGTGDPTIPRPNIPRKNFPLFKIENSFPAKLSLSAK